MVSQPLILPPAMLGILGGGQLGRMFAVAAKTMGYRVMVLDPAKHPPAAEFADVHLCARYDDEGALRTLAEQCVAISTEFENVDADSMHWLAKYTRVAPSASCVAITQDREQEKAWIQKAGLPTASYQIIRCEEDVNQPLEDYLPGILKTTTLGYDGKGQVRISHQNELLAAWRSLGGVPCILERQLDLRHEISVIVCRLDSQHIECYQPAENYHENGILAYSVVPARLPESVLNRASDIAKKLANTLDYVGVLAVEMFVVGQHNELIVNEMAPRPHNSGHHTLDACVTSQFQQQVRLMCGLPPADVTLLSPCCMANILGDVWRDDGHPYWENVLMDSQAHLHLYGKHEARMGRKMGHFTVLEQDANQAFNRAKLIHGRLSGAK